ncbi:multidrug effflux MFS transporter [Terrihabitans sp. B22-R8]|uniref:multidrug effflux MFS transporter n=1 Tax=Terrihabitans sp. B22-R8 TaxID=3425128 RepID=UPI00403C60C4
MTVPAASPHPGMGFKQFVSLIAALMAVNALAIDSMLPALPAIGDALGIATENERQWVVTAYLLGFGSAQIVYGTLADRFGRKRMLTIGLSIYVIASIVAAFSTSFEMMMMARIAQGLGSAATRVLVVAVVRDCYSGRQMARVMSLSFIVFLAVPILAPSLGQIIMLVVPWRGIFGFLTLFGLAVLVWMTLRLPETLHPENRVPISFKGVTHAFAASFSNRTALGYNLAMTMMLGGLFSFINSAQQIFADVFHASNLFTTIFALIAVFMALSSFLNSKVVGRFGTHKVSHLALFGFIAFSVANAVFAFTDIETLWSFAILQAGTMFCFGLIVSNFGTMAMQPLGHVAGTASSVQGFISTTGGALIGFYVGQHFDGTILPLTLGFSLCGLMALVMVLIAEKGVLFRSTERPLPPVSPV